jgi:hypothetical protein
MDSWVIYTLRQPSVADLRDFVLRYGGYWNDEPSLDEGVIEHGAGTLYIASQPAFADEITAQDIDALRLILGGAPNGAISIHIGGDDRPFELAARIAQSLARDWNGYIYKQQGPIGTAQS